MANLLSSLTGIVLSVAVAYHEAWYGRDHDRHGPAYWIAALALGVALGLVPVARRCWHELQEEGERRARLARRLERD